MLKIKWRTGVPEVRARHEAVAVGGLNNVVRPDQKLDRHIVAGDAGSVA